MMKDFREKYRALKIESNRGKITFTYYMENQSLSRQIYHSQRTRRDSQGRDYYQERKGGMIQEEDNTIEGIIEENLYSQEIFQEI